MQPNTDDPLIPREDKATRGGYQSIEGGTEGSTVDVQRTFFSQVQDAKAQSQGFCDFCTIFFGLLIGSIVWTIVMAVTLTLPLAMLIVGAMYFHECEQEFMIPIFMIVAGCVITVSNVMNLIVRYRRYEGVSRPRAIVGWITVFINIFLMGWFFVGCYWVYHIRFPTEAGCNHTLYYFAYWLLTGVFLFFGTVVLFSALTLCLAMICW